MSCGTPVIAFNAGGIPELVIDGVNGKLAPPGNVSQLSNAIIALSMDAETRNRLGTNCRRQILNQHSLETQARSYEKLYHELVVSHSIKKANEGDTKSKLACTTGTRLRNTITSVFGSMDQDFLRWTCHKHLDLAREKELYKNLLKWDDQSECFLDAENER